MGTISTRMIYLWIIAHIFSLILRILLILLLRSTLLRYQEKEQSSELPNFMGFTAIMIDDIVF